jgi:hypothetical protein
MQTFIENYGWALILLGIVMCCGSWAALDGMDRGERARRLWRAWKGMKG